MNRKLPLFFLPAIVVLAAAVGFAVPCAAQDVEEVVRKIDELYRANSSYAKLEMEIVNPHWQRTLLMDTWTEDTSKTFIRILSPPKEKGLATLRLKNEMWNYLPRANKVIKIPPSMMMSSWMGSDFTNDDLVRQSSIIVDYNHTIIGEEQMNGYNCYKIEMIPKPEAGVVWGKIISWISKEGYLQLQADYYDEDLTLIKSMTGTKIKEMGGRTIPTHWEMIPHDNPGQKTIMDYIKITFNIKIDNSFFSQQNMKRVR